MLLSGVAGSEQYQRCAPLEVVPAICLRAFYATSGTDIAYGHGGALPNAARVLREHRYLPTRLLCSVPYLRAAYALASGKSGTESVLLVQYALSSCR
eukprot:3118762-Rhodomonas_salina.1